MTHARQMSWSSRANRTLQSNLYCPLNIVLCSRIEEKSIVGKKVITNIHEHTSCDGKWIRQKQRQKQKRKVTTNIYEQTSCNGKYADIKKTTTNTAGQLRTLKKTLTFTRGGVTQQVTYIYTTISSGRLSLLAWTAWPKWVPLETLPGRSWASWCHAPYSRRKT